MLKFQQNYDLFQCLHTINVIIIIIVIVIIIIVIAITTISILIYMSLSQKGWFSSMLPYYCDLTTFSATIKFFQTSHHKFRCQYMIIKKNICLILFLFYFILFYFILFYSILFCLISFSLNWYQRLGWI